MPARQPACLRTFTPARQPRHHLPACPPARPPACPPTRLPAHPPACQSDLLTTQHPFPAQKRRFENGSRAHYASNGVQQRQQRHVRLAAAVAAIEGKQVQPGGCEGDQHEADCCIPAASTELVQREPGSLNGMPLPRRGRGLQGSGHQRCRDPGCHTCSQLWACSPVCASSPRRLNA